MSSKRLSQSERDRIVELRLQRVPIRSICAQLDVASATVVSVWQQWLSDSAAERSESLQSARAEAIARLDRIASDARLGAATARAAGQTAVAARCLAIERQAVMDAAKIDGFDAALQTPVVKLDQSDTAASEHAARWLTTWLDSETGLLLDEIDRLSLERIAPLVAKYWQTRDAALLTQIEAQEATLRKRARMNRYKPKRGAG